MVDDNIEPTPIACEMHARFTRKMALRGKIDRILNGGEPIEKRAAAPDDEIALRRRQIDTQMTEYGAAIAAALTWFREWKSKRKGFRASRRTPTGINP